MTATLKIYYGGEIGGFSGALFLGGKRYAVPHKVVWTQESINTEAYAEFCNYDSADEVRAAARKMLRRLSRGA